MSKVKIYTDLSGDSIEVDTTYVDFGTGTVFIHSVDEHGDSIGGAIPVGLGLEQVRELVEQLQEALDTQTQID